MFLDIPEDVLNLQNVVISFTEVITNLILLSLLFSDNYKTKMIQDNLSLSKLGKLLNTVTLT